MLAAELQIAETTVAEPAPDFGFFARGVFAMHASVLDSLHFT